jgi:hypothetical protein
MRARLAMKSWGVVALGLAVLSAGAATAQSSNGRTRADAARQRAEVLQEARVAREDAREDRRAEIEAAREERRAQRVDAREDQTDRRDERVVDREVRFERPELGGPRLENVRPSETSLRDPSDVGQPSALVTLSPGFGAGDVTSPTPATGAPVTGGGFTGTAASAGQPVIVGGSDVTFNTQNVINRTVADPRVQVVGVPVPTVGAGTYVFQSYVRNEVSGERRQQPQRQQLPAADEPLADHTEALRGLIDANTEGIQQSLGRYRLVDAGRVLDRAQAATLREQVQNSQVALGSRDILTRSLRERRAIKPGHVVVGVVPDRAVILISARTDEDN